MSSLLKEKNIENINDDVTKAGPSPLTVNDIAKHINLTFYY